MRMRYAELVGKTVVDAEGTTVGRVADLVAERRGDALCVTALLVGPGALLRRIAFRRLPLLGAPVVLRIPWQQIDAIDRRIRLRPDAPRATDGQGAGEGR
jgi:sporulation protein YlmC with PRC-barrel domain